MLHVYSTSAALAMPGHLLNDHEGGIMAAWHNPVACSSLATWQPSGSNTVLQPSFQHRTAAASLSTHKHAFVAARDV
jgi:hypothetical protein